MFTRVAKYMNKGLSYPSNLLSAAAMVAIAFVVLAVVADVFMRYAFNSPIFGTWDLCRLAFTVIVWGPMAMAAMKGSHVAVTFLLEKLPRLPRLGAELIIALVTTGMLGLVSWRLVMQGIVLQTTGTETGTLRISYAPFAYFTAFACAVMALAFLARVPETVGKIRKEPEAVGKTQEQAEGVAKLEKMKGSSV
jgi:TRAP-type C4-dicarboxylate transport system permease small subunit